MPPLRKWWIVPRYARRKIHLSRLPNDIYHQFQTIASSPLIPAQQSQLTGRDARTLQRLPRIDFSPYLISLTWADALDLYRLLGRNNLTRPFIGELLKGRTLSDPTPTPTELTDLRIWAKSTFNPNGKPL